MRQIMYLKGKPIRKKSNRPERILFRKAWKVFSEYIRRRDKGICCTCGARNDWKEMNAGHYRHNKLDFDEMNINCQCTACNKYHHDELGSYARFIIGKYGLETHDDLVRRSNHVHKYMPWELEAVIAKYKEKIEALNRR